MSRVAIALAVGMIAGVATAAGAAPEPPAPVAAKKETAKKKLAAKSAKQSGKKRVAKKRTRAAAKKRVASKPASKREAKHRVKIARTPQIAVASHQGDGRVKYGRDNMPPGFAWPATKAMKSASKACEEALDALGVRWEPAPPKGRMVDPVYIKDLVIAGITYTSAYRKGPHAIDCQLARTLAVVGPDLRALGVREVTFGSIYRNTKVRVHGQRKNILSRHALGLAMDIRSFVDETGRVADVELDYLKGDPLLHAIEDSVNRSNRFRIVLTPGNDPLSHYDHFHIEASVDFTAFR
jgi:hypothetical protein